MESLIVFLWKSAKWRYIEKAPIGATYDNDNDKAMMELNRKRDERKLRKEEEKKRQEAHNKRMAELRMQVHVDWWLGLKYKASLTDISCSTWTTMLLTVHLAGKDNKEEKVRTSSWTRTPSPAWAASPQRRRSSGVTWGATRWQGSTTLWQMSQPRLSLSTSGRLREGAASTFSFKNRSATSCHHELGQIVPRYDHHVCNSRVITIRSLSSLE